MPVLILTGPPAAGKNAIAAATAKLLDRCAIIDVDVVRLMVVERETLPNAAFVDVVRQGAVPSVARDHYAGHEWRSGVRAACALGHRFLREGYGLIIADILTAASARAYRNSFRSERVLVAQLLPHRDEIARRHAARIAAEGFDKLGDPALVDVLYDQQAQFGGYDLRIDNAGRSAENVAQELALLLA